ncbi:MAG: hypothetical protein KDA84_12995, partial [Planctomycetaceae bacterium]|nr:hypothetical protein [Planctomycetaceae bacterium]
QVDDQPTFESLLKENTVSCAASFRRYFWNQVGGVDETLQGFEDYDFWIRIAKAGARIRRIPGDHFYYRKHGESLTNHANRNQHELLRRILGKHNGTQETASVQTNTEDPPNGNAGKWNGWYAGVNHSRPFGKSTTYLRAAEYLQDLDQVEDWGCGLGWFRQYIPPEKYRGIDGSHSNFADHIVDLTTYRSDVDGILLRHVLEHNYQWKQILQNAIASFKKKLCLILFTPFAEKTSLDYTEELAPGKSVPYLRFARRELIQCFADIPFREESVGGETIFYLNRKKNW